MRRPHCHHCEGSDVKLRRQIVANGSSQIAWFCVTCDRWAEKPPVWLSHEVVKEELQKHGGYTIEDIPVVEDRSDLYPCMLCGQPGEVHHWAPRALQEEFGDDWYKWPTAVLCPEHHMLWHRIMERGSAHE